MTAERMWCLSESVYNGLCQIMGTPEEVSFRREIADVEDILYDRIAQYDQTEFRIIRSGSNREGFRLSGSDMDFMFYDPEIKLVLEMPSSYDIDVENVILLRFSETHPGFTYIKAISATDTMFERLTTYRSVNNEEGFYVSNLKFKALVFPAVEEDSEFTFAHSHGPCMSGRIENNDVDYAFCFKCDEWPTPALPFIDRCRSNIWPTSPLLADIVKDGCHVVAIGKNGSNNEEFEWRISFSLAEQKLVYSINHCQFLCYGLLKLFLKEVLNKDVDNPLLCSYFLKTALFWEIQTGNINIWCPQNTLFCFWACFKRLLKWVYFGYCPNFFIPENNMFSGKIEGGAQYELFNQLTNLYHEGFLCLSRCDSIRSYIQRSSKNGINVRNQNDILLTADFLIPLEIEKNLFCQQGMENNTTKNIVDELLNSEILSEYQTFVLLEFKNKLPP